MKKLLQVAYSLVNSRKILSSYNIYFNKKISNVNALFYSNGLGKGICLKVQLGLAKSE